MTKLSGVTLSGQMLVFEAEMAGDRGLRRSDLWHAVHVRGHHDERGDFREAAELFDLISSRGEVLMRAAQSTEVGRERVVLPPDVCTLTVAALCHASVQSDPRYRAAAWRLAPRRVLQYCVQLRLAGKLTAALQNSQDAGAAHEEIQAAVDFIVADKRGRALAALLASSSLLRRRHFWATIVGATDSPCPLAQVLVSLRSSRSQLC